ncbi:nucleotidyltransferase family protein [Microbacterium sp. Marseille-Q6648]|uniref:nucleotidyltransferase family protein n=1 Tax=Microbacterium sp. Marseille-Q6648 TaxID=2937991 RepID=UPI00203B5D2C|nr:nucleotidyltransferase family protein [Microbacterium sp. Marseille-Q6648]
MNHDVPAEVAIPLPVRLRLGRAAAQTIADRDGLDLLHIKGDAVDLSLRPHPTPGTDIDVLVRPRHLSGFDAALRAEGWRVYTTFAYGSPFEHAQTYTHELWGYLDVHRFFPGVGLDPDHAFDRLWRTRGSMDFGGVSCPVPSVPAQAAILVLNAARSRPGSRADVDRLWRRADAATRASIEREVSALDAHVALAAATGGLRTYRSARDYHLWRVVSEGGSRLEEWWGRLRAADSLGARARIVVRAPLVNVPHLEHELGRRPTPGEIVREFFARPARGAIELVRRLTRRRSS